MAPMSAAAVDPWLKLVSPVPPLANPSVVLAVPPVKMSLIPLLMSVSLVALPTIVLDEGESLAAALADAFDAEGVWTKLDVQTAFEPKPMISALPSLLMSASKRG